MYRRRHRPMSLRIVVGMTGAELHGLGEYQGQRPGDRIL